jgi:ribose 5-phosphate isomerase B
MIVRIYVASDHAGLELKVKLMKSLMDSHFVEGVKREVHDLGPQSTDSVDYPDYADLVCQKIHGFTLIDSENHAAFPNEIGILICGSGQGMAMRANKYTAIRAALCWNPESARLSREHNDANVLCLSSRLISDDVNLKILETFLTTAFAGGRHLSRVAKVSQPVR